MKDLMAQVDRFNRQDLKDIKTCDLEYMLEEDAKDLQGKVDADGLINVLCRGYDVRVGTKFSHIYTKYINVYQGCDIVLKYLGHLYLIPGCGITGIYSKTTLKNIVL